MAIEKQGRRAGGTGVVHDIDGTGKNHMVAVDYYPQDGVTTDKHKTAWAPHVFRDSFRVHPHPEMVYQHMTGSQNVIGAALRCESLPDRSRIIGKFADFATKPRAAQAFREIQDGTLKGFSYYFSGGVHEPIDPKNRSRGIRYTKARLEDWGPVDEPSIERAVAVGLRSSLFDLLADPALTANIRRVLARLDRRLGAGRRIQPSGFDRDAEVARVRRRLDRHHTDPAFVDRLVDWMALEAECHAGVMAQERLLRDRAIASGDLTEWRAGLPERSA